MPDPTRAAIAPRPLCAASELLGRRHRVGAEIRAHVVGTADGIVWHFCSRRCLLVWWAMRLDAAS